MRIHKEELELFRKMFAGREMEEKKKKVVNIHTTKVIEIKEST